MCNNIQAQYESFKYIGNLPRGEFAIHENIRVAKIKFKEPNLYNVSIKFVYKNSHETYMSGLNATM